jgi:hypothetical protein
MSKAHQVIFECPKCKQNISIQRKSAKASLSVVEARETFAGEEIHCDKPDCRWHGKASRLKLLEIVPFDWIYSPTV